jgi:CheY-like chemotaxis protein
MAARCAVADAVCTDGVPLVRRLKHDEQMRHVPLVILSGRAALVGEAPVVERVGANMFVATPCAPDDLERAVAALLLDGQDSPAVRPLPTPAASRRR